ncbi:MAG: hypothetical protein ABS911_12635 [Carnobacterium sp.]|uniref:hypothetical protein n=1 Tax=Carnobacterium sp. TaxID=48221 RepID=UPI00331606A3
MNHIKDILSSVLSFLKTTFYDNYNAGIFGTYAEWAGIIFTILTIIFTLRFYNKDNRIVFRVAVNKKNKQTKTDEGIIYSADEIYIIQAINLSKMSETVYFDGIRYKYAFFEKLWIKMKNNKIEYLQTTISVFFESGDKFEYVGPRNSTKEQIFESHWIDDFVVNRFKKTNKPVTIEVVYANATGQEFTQDVLFSKKDIKYIESIRENFKDRIERRKSEVLLKKELENKKYKDLL